ncbi:hypothetical protein [Halobacteriovorax sp. JY17]|uniref:hypothetical protein n=1 Tax=Halobacteriovorax sp. JY17 TaxID=2014617 RepID=UPI000C361DA9|nr:hypothetical protein [Halobacteriovorax sp. JY17]PIK15164.1 MAG: hypothetical protein CES88_00195 [Halobacteriovorax sp. JY17]
MRLVSLLLLLAFFTSCGAQKNKKHTQYLEGTKQYAVSANAFSSYITAFEKEAAKNLSEPNFKVGDIPINFGDTTKDEFDGVCNTYSDGTKEILIKKSWWESTDKTQREIMIFHELGHCRLGRDHDEEIVTTSSNKTYKTSVMNPVIPHSDIYLEKRSAYLTELYLYNKTALLESFGIN